MRIRGKLQQISRLKHHWCLRFLFELYPKVALQDDEQIDGGLSKPGGINVLLLSGDSHHFQTLFTKHLTNAPCGRVADVERFFAQDMEDLWYLMFLIHGLCLSIGIELLLTGTNCCSVFPRARLALDGAMHFPARQTLSPGPTRELCLRVTALSCGSSDR
jgi:hypothetical protein